LKTIPIAFINEKENPLPVCHLCKNPHHVASVCQSIVPTENYTEDDLPFADKIKKARQIALLNGTRQTIEIDDPSKLTSESSTDIHENETDDAPSNQITELSSDSTPPRDQTSASALHSNVRSNSVTTPTAENPPHSTKRSHRRESTAESTNSDTITNKLPKTDLLSQSLDKKAPLSQDILDSVSSTIISDPNFTKLQMDLPDFKEFLSDLTKFSAKDMAKKVLSEYTNDVPAFLKSLNQIRSSIKNKSIKNRITRLTKQCSLSEDSLDQETESELSALLLKYTLDVICLCSLCIHLDSVTSLPIIPIT